MQCINIYYNYNLFKTRRIWACTKTIIQITFELYNTLLVMNILIFFFKNFIHITLLSALQLLQYHSTLTVNARQVIQRTNHNHHMQRCLRYTYYCKHHMATKFSCFSLLCLFLSVLSF